MTTPDEDEAARAIVPEAIPMQCVSAYPCPPELVRLRDIPCGPYGRFGFSNHCLELGPALGAVALGACAVELHVGWDRRAYGSDAGHSLTIDEFARFCRECRALEAALSSSVDKDELATQLTATRAQFLHREPEDAGCEQS